MENLPLLNVSLLKGMYLLLAFPSSQLWCTVRLYSPYTEVKVELFLGDCYWLNVNVQGLCKGQCNLGYRISPQQVVSNLFGAYFSVLVSAVNLSVNAYHISTSRFVTTHTASSLCST